LQLLRFRSGSYIFFGTAMNAAETAVSLARKAEQEDPAEGMGPRILVLDFKGVIGVDSTAAKALAAIGTSIATLPGSWTLIAAGATPHVAHVLKHAAGLKQGMEDDESETVSTDSVLERCENMLLKHTKKPGTGGTATLKAILAESLGEKYMDAKSVVDQVIALFRRRELKGGEKLFVHGDEPSFLGIVERGSMEATAPVSLRFSIGCLVGDLDYVLNRRRTFSLVSAQEGTIVQVLERSDVENAPPLVKECIATLMLRGLAMTAAHAGDIV